MFSIVSRAHATISCPAISGSPAPVITVQPVNDTADIGATGNTAAFQVLACEGGTIPNGMSTALSFQWQYFSTATGWTNFGTGTDYSGSTNGGSGSAAGPFSSCASSTTPCTSAFTTIPVTSTTLFAPASSVGLSVHVLVSDVNGIGVASNSVFLYTNAAPQSQAPLPPRSR